MARLLALMLLLALGPAAADAAAARTFHVDDRAGADSRDGLAPERAWRSLERVNAARLEPGDTVLLRRGGAWTGGLVLRASGREGRPITVGAYGSGPPPALTGGRVGIAGSGTAWIVVRDLAIADMRGPGIAAEGARHWRIENVRIRRTGLGHDGHNRDFAGIQLWHGQDLTIAGAELDDIRGDGIWAWAVKGLRILDSRIGAVHGAAADNIHLYAPQDFVIRGNRLSMERSTGSGKGNLHSQAGARGVIERNEFRGGNYGVGSTDSDVIIRANRFAGHNGEKWAAAILVSEVHDIANVTVEGNEIADATMGIYVFQRHDRRNFVVRNNVFSELGRAAMVVESPISGEFAQNVIRGRAEAIIDSGWKVRGEAWRVRDNTLR